MTGRQVDGGAAWERDAASAGALHDFNNAVQATKASLHWLERRAARGGAGDLLGMIAAVGDQVSRMGSLGAGLAHSPHAEGPAANAAVAVGSSVHAMAHQVSALLDSRIRPVLQVDADAGEVTCDPARLESAIRNLVLNARDAMPDGNRLSLFQLRAFATEMGGAVRLRSRVGHGTQVTILRPCAAPPHQ